MEDIENQILGKAKIVPYDEEVGTPKNSINLKINTNEKDKNISKFDSIENSKEDIMLDQETLEKMSIEEISKALM